MRVAPYEPFEEHRKMSYGFWDNPGEVTQATPVDLLQDALVQYEPGEWVLKPPGGGPQSIEFNKDGTLGLFADEKTGILINPKNGSIKIVGKSLDSRCESITTSIFMRFNLTGGMIPSTALTPNPMLLPNFAGVVTQMAGIAGSLSDL